jgi:hypothetical protein
VYDQGLILSNAIVENWHFLDRYAWKGIIHPIIEVLYKGNLQAQKQAETWAGSRSKSGFRRFERQRQNIRNATSSHECDTVG